MYSVPGIPPNDIYAWNGGVNASNNYTPNGLNQYSTVAGASFTYDANANLTSDGSTAYGYDVENRLVSASGAHTAALTYDPNGRLFQLTGTAPNNPAWGSGITWGTGSAHPFSWTAASSGATQFLYDGEALVAEYDASGNLLRRYVHGPGQDEPLVWYEGSNLSNRRFLHADHQGSIVAVSEVSGGTSAINSYDEYGVQGTLNSGRFQYTGQIWLPEAGVYHYKARAYSPALGRFMQTDPVGYQDQMNLYAYVGDDPVNHEDASGNENNDQCTGSHISAGHGPSVADCQFTGYASSQTTGGTGQPPTSAAKLGRSAGNANSDVYCIGGKCQRIYRQEPSLVDLSPWLYGAALKKAPAVVFRLLKSFFSKPEVPKDSERVIARAAQEPGKYHNFPSQLDPMIMRGTRQDISPTYRLYSARGYINTQAGQFEIGVKPATETEPAEITHRLFNPD